MPEPVETQTGATQRNIVLNWHQELLEGVPAVWKVIVGAKPLQNGGYCCLVAKGQVVTRQVPGILHGSKLISLVRRSPDLRLCFLTK